MHWADVLAADLAERGSRHVLATAITPSGPIHVGNMREVLTTEMVHRALLDRGCESELVYIGDTYDPLRKVYPFLDERRYAEHVGKPLSDIPCPDDCHASYAEHFLEPFLADLAALGVTPTVLRADQMYRDGRYLDATREALDNLDRVRAIIGAVSKRDLPRDWLPFNVQCEACGRIKGPKPTLYEYPMIDYACICGHEGQKDITIGGGGKLPWRLDWPARWRFLEVTFEAMGKDHAAAGGSWDTGVRLAQDVFHHRAPVRTVYEFIQLKGAGAMHSSAGNAVSASQMLRMTPPEVMRFLIARYQPNKHIDFDPGLGLIDLVNDYDRWERAYFEGGTAAREEAQFKELDRVIELAQPHGIRAQPPPAVPFNHLVLLTEIAGDWPGVRKILERTDITDGIAPDDETLLRARVEHARYWLEHFAPEEARTRLVDEWTHEASAALAPEHARFYPELAKRLQNGAWQAEAIHNAIHEAGQASGVSGGKAFQAIYLAFLGKKRGPRAGHFLASLERNFVLKRLDQAHAATATES